ncbi:MAG: alpha-aminoadipate/glutamate carrier protein LysW/ArgW [Candidatus Caldarchaeum sp.]|nr:alpha-aminoadipate/glutamate carrier protein LysW/ArgW [Candidatus Caldarchaeum sp.]MCX8201421.1 alpha-aminoadipate/glutamate carrier protein LysW/ArgW [Candidatus Caldarchaeum sp.]
MVKLACPVCGSSVEVPSDSLPGELFECGDCGAQLEYFVDEKNAASLRVAEEVAEDWGQ